jgi:hypothetical protein
MDDVMILDSAGVGASVHRTLRDQEQYHSKTYQIIQEGLSIIGLQEARRLRSIALLSVCGSPSTQ